MKNLQSVAFFVSLSDKIFDSYLSMKRSTVTLLLIFFSFAALCAQSRFDTVKTFDGFTPQWMCGDLCLTPPAEGLWSVAFAWRNDAPADWHHVHAEKCEQAGEWTILSGELPSCGGRWLLRDAYRAEGDLLHCIRRYEWQGQRTLDSVTLGIRWQLPVCRTRPFLPGILYYGNPSGARNTPDNVVCYSSQPEEFALFEEHRYPMPFASFEAECAGRYAAATLFTVPSPLSDSRYPDHWWSLGLRQAGDRPELLLLSGPVGYNGRPGACKALQKGCLQLPAQYLAVRPGTVIEKEFLLALDPAPARGAAFQRPVHRALEVFCPFSTEGLPSYDGILRAKYRMARSRWIEDDCAAGFNMYPEPRRAIVMGWCGQAASPGYFLQHLGAVADSTAIRAMVQRSLDFLSGTPFSDKGFCVAYDLRSHRWSSRDPVSMGQAMYNFALAIRSARRTGGYDTARWETFLRRACDFAAHRIGDPAWHPRSTAEAFFIAPLVIASELFGCEAYIVAAVKAAEHYAARHLSMDEPYWGGTLDASGEDKEGAWAAFQGFLALYEYTHDSEHLRRAQHAADVCLSYTVVWDIPLPAGRLADRALRTRGWTSVSPQNQHLDVYGVLYAPELYRLGMYTHDEALMHTARVMYRSCGQLIDPWGSQGEQIQQTNFAQQGDLSDVARLRGGYSEGWTVFWITAHFLNAAAKFDEMGVRP